VGGEWKGGEALGKQVVILYPDMGKTQDMKKKAWVFISIYSNV
jgi:hypothetical protein